MNTDTNNARTVEFVGYPSGDWESFCWDVDHETFVRIMGEEPERFDRSRMGRDGNYRLYPDAVLGLKNPFTQPKRMWVQVKCADVGGDASVS